MNEASGALVAFAIISIAFLGFYLVIPATYIRMNATDLGAVGNATLDTAMTFSTSLQGVFGILILILGVVSLLLVILFVAGRR